MPLHNLIVLVDVTAFCWLVLNHISPLTTSFKDVEVDSLLS